MHDDELIKGCLKGSKRHFNELYEKYSYSLYGICLRYSNDEDDAKDILQEGFIKVFTHLKTFDDKKGAFEHWLKRIFVNQAIDMYRKKSIMADSLQAGDLSDEIPEEEHGEGINLTQEELLEMVRELPAGYRTVFNLFVIENMGHKEIATMLGISESTSKSQFFKGRKLLQEKIKHRLLISQSESR